MNKIDSAISPRGNGHFFFGFFSDMTMTVHVILQTRGYSLVQACASYLEAQRPTSYKTLNDPSITNEIVLMRGEEQKAEQRIEELGSNKGDGGEDGQDYAIVSLPPRPPPGPPPPPHAYQHYL